MNHVRVAGALARYEVEQLGRGFDGEASPFLTADTICRKYGLRGLWKRTLMASLRALHREGEAVRLRSFTTNKTLKIGSCYAYANPEVDWRKLREMDLVKYWSYRTD